jgi:propionate CoA-transferase
VSRFGTFNPGAGGFIDIAHNARELVFTGTFTTAGLKLAFSQDGVRVETEGKARKFVESVEQITYPVRKGVAERGQRPRSSRSGPSSRLCPRGWP